MIKEAKKTVLNSEPGWVRTGQRKVRGSSWLIEAVSYGAEPVELVPNRFRRLIKSSKFGQKVSNWIKKQTKETVLNSELGWVRTRQRKVRGSSWLIEAASYGAEPVQLVQRHSWLPLSAMWNPWPFFVWFSLIRARNWEPFLSFVSLFSYKVFGQISDFLSIVWTSWEPVQPVQHHSWLPLSTMRNPWPFFVRFSLIRAQNWEPFLLFESSLI